MFIAAAASAACCSIALALSSSAVASRPPCRREPPPPLTSSTSGKAGASPKDPRVFEKCEEVSEVAGLSDMVEEVARERAVEVARLRKELAALVFHPTMAA